jgi:phage gpG-like protein
MGAELACNIKLRITGLKGMSHDLKMIKRRMKDLRPVWPKANASLKAYMIANFTSQGLPSGGWAPLDAEYGSWKIRNYPGSPMLVKEGGLFSKIAQGPDVDGNLRSATFSFAGEIPKFHQYGTTKMPARPIIFASEEWTEDVAQMIADYIVDGVE